MITGFHHIQLAMPKGAEQDARAFYGGALGLTEVAKPTELARRGGVWFEHGAVRVHLGVDEAFVPARKAHPALEVDNLEAAFEALARHVTEEISELPGFRRFYISDPCGNRIEIVQVL